MSSKRSREMALERGGEIKREGKEFGLGKTNET